MPTFCRHNRFIERCPICSRGLPGAEPEHGPRPARAKSAGARSASSSRRGGVRAEGVRVLRHERAVADGYSSHLLPGVHASADAERLASEIAFSAGRLRLLREDPPQMYGDARALVATDVDAAARTCFLIAYLSPGEGDAGGTGETNGDAAAGGEADDAFAAIRATLADPGGVLPALDRAQLGPRTSHDPARGTQTLDAYERLIAQAGGAEAAFAGDASWTPTRRFERLFERVALPGFTRAGRYELLTLLGALGMADLQADSLHLGVARGAASNDPTMLAAKRVFAIGDPINLERRAQTLASACGLEVGVLELALWNFFSPQRATLGFPPGTRDDAAHDRSRDALGL